MGELDHSVCHQLDLHCVPTYDHGIGSREPSIYARRCVYHDMDKEPSSYTIARRTWCALWGECPSGSMDVPFGDCNEPGPLWKNILPI